MRGLKSRTASCSWELRITAPELVSVGSIPLFVSPESHPWQQEVPMCGPPALQSPPPRRVSTHRDTEAAPESWLSLPHFLGERCPQETLGTLWSLGDKGNMEEPEPLRYGVSLLIYLHSVNRALPG